MTDRRSRRGLDPRVTLVWGLGMALAGLVATDLRAVAVLLVSILVVVAAGGALGQTVRRQRRLWALVGALGALWGLLLPGQPVLELPIGLTVSGEGLLFGLIWAGRVLVVIVPLGVVVGTTTTLDWLRLFTALSCRLAVTLAILRLLAVGPLLLAEWRRLAVARAARADPLSASGPIDRLRYQVMLLPLAARRARRQVALTSTLLEARGGASQRLRADFAPLTPGDYAVLAFTGLLALLTVASLVANRDLIADLVTGAW